MAEEKNLEVNNTNENKDENKENTVTCAVAEKVNPTAPVYEDYEQHEVAKKPKKKFKKRFLIIPAVVLAIGGYVAYSMNAAKNTVVFVSTADVEKGSIENILSISGTVQSAESKTFFSDVTAPVSEVTVKVGDKVSKGDLLITFDEASIDLAKQTAQLAIKQAKSSYNAYFTGSAVEDRKYAEGMNAQQINERIDAITAEIDIINNRITEKTSRMNLTLTELQKAQFDLNNPNAGQYQDYSSENQERLYDVQQSMYDVQYALSNDPEIQGWKKEITALQEEQSHLQSAKAAQLNFGTIASAKASLESTTLAQEDTISKLDKAKEGIKADFNGVVTAVSIVEGATATSGAQLITLADLDNVEVSIQISKSDLPKISIGQKVDVTINNKQYDGTVSKISGTATKNNNGVAVVDTIIKINNPDSDIILGVEANNKIHAQKADDTIVLPYEYVQTDSEGDFVYVVEDNTVVRKNVTIGIASSTQAQITDGLTAGEQIVTGGYDTLSDGMVVAVNEQ